MAKAMSKQEALSVLISEAEKDRGTRKRMLRVERALKALELTEAEIRYAMTRLDYWDNDGQPYGFYRDPSAVVPERGADT